MSRVLTEAPRAGAFLVWEVHPDFCRETVTVAAGQTLAAGEIVQKAAGDTVIAADGVLDEQGALVTPVAGIVVTAVDASDGARPGVLIARGPALVDGADLIFPPETNGQRAAVLASLATLGLRVL
ncbi:head decoration protein [Pararhodospirillum photometricum]|uniref:Head decoration protein n=1 Tax=Pararhodospirillum photometricum DSM 122 TaxID=1150469 RepID=H6SKQ2_PARPM|nr:head decoration protein [Pararhodospirillum photometricum]CCG08567.1 Putative uncharacterized protein [Pararhodospirillum photometricum DSM 122]